MNSESELSADSPGEELVSRSPIPPTSRLALSIRALFDGKEPSARPPSMEGEDLSVSHPSEPFGGEDPSAGLRSGARDRFVTRLATFLRANSENREKLVPGILEDGALLRKEGAHSLILDAVASLLGSESQEGVDLGAERLAEQLMDPLLAHYLALRIAGEKVPEASGPLIVVAHRFPRLSAPALAEILAESSERDSRRTLRELLTRLGADGREAVLNLLRDSRWYAVRNGVRFCAEAGDPEMVQALTVLLAHPDPRVRKETVIALARIGGEDAGLLLVGMLNDLEPAVRQVAAMGVGSLQVIRALRPLLEMLVSETDEEVQVQVLFALGRIGDPGAVPAIEKKAVGSMFSRPPRRLRIAAYRALAAIGTPHARALVEAGAVDKDLGVRQAMEDLLAGRESPQSGGAS